MFGQTDGSVHVWLQRLDEREIVAFFFRWRIIIVGRRIVIDLEIGDGEREVERIGRVGGARQFVGRLRADVSGELCLFAGEQADGRSEQKECDTAVCKQETNAAQRFEAFWLATGDDAPNGKNGEKRPEDGRSENSEFKAAVQWNGAGQKEETDEKNEFVHDVGSLWIMAVRHCTFFEKYVILGQEK